MSVSFKVESPETDGTQTSDGDQTLIIIVGGVAGVAIVVIVLLVLSKRRMRMDIE